MTKQPVLVLGPLMPYLLAELEKRYAVEKLYAEKDALKFLQENAGRFRAAVTSTFTGITADMIDLLPQVEIISSFGVGTDSLDVAYANSRGIRVANTPDVLNEDTANMALLLLLAATRDLVKNDRFVREGRWARGESAPLASGIEGKRVGLVGLGRIGSVIAQKLLAFGCDVAYHTRSRKPDAPYTYYDNLVDLARDSAALIAILPGGEATRGVISREVLQALGPDGTFVNVARGTVVDEAALVELLQSGELGRAGLDVFADEPNVPEALFKLDNVVLQPHMGSATLETRRAMADRVVTNLEDYFAEKP
ncbi:2-hydroxyacid dehydrogenase [Phyllobacterium myrsinacearum]|uniref:Hydroxyacid dehydrogenase n=1 Tax=Phyllobacterium myrsinacearum TaxID=28101 RepID=A0A2S9JL22_9HYPH|nr:2-hydroxyacid dehydrogenase [Phyllobacterium myrsinacearum]PRD53645.1 hydroxyacid dehydrogenase [Phyllobacterium myrsinacearum]PWV87821.1 hydroxypyruvate reductase 2 [Phyllobacterium myrsinacearum]RZV07919.1 hydroxypyruvate reductase 2 [Phyllobacterium myrsinacearum]